MTHEIHDLLKAMDQSKRRWAGIKESSFAEYTEKVFADVKHLVGPHDGIFVKHIRDELDANIFYMLAQQRLVEEGRLTPDEATIRINRHLSKSFVEPQFDATKQKPATLTYAEYRAKQVRQDAEDHEYVG